MKSEGYSNKITRDGDFSIVSGYGLGYRNKEDVTNLPPGVLIVGSQNVLVNDADRVQIRQGYSLDGEMSSVEGPVLSSFDWLTSRGNLERHIRVGGLTSAGNDGKMQFRYVDDDGEVSWVNLLTGLTTANYNFCTYWNTTEQVREMLFVNGQPRISAWNGAIAVVNATTATTITIQGTDTWADKGFYTAGNKVLNIANGSAFTYSGGETTLTLTGISPSPASIAPGTLIFQGVVNVTNASMSAIPATFENGLIENLNNQIFVGSLDAPSVYISKVNDYTDYSSSSPRQAGEGAVLILDENTVAFKPQEQFMYVSAGQDQWYNVNFELQTSTVGTTYEQVNAERLKTGKRQGARSQAFVSHMKNNIVAVTFEPTIDMIGRMENYFGTPQTANISDSIKNDVDSYDFENGSISYWRYYILVAVPEEGIVRMYNLSINAWEAPQTLPVSRFYIVDGELYGHSYNTFESYKLFTGYADRVYDGFQGFPISSVWRFSYQHYGTRTQLKSARELYIEGYINSNTELTAQILYELDGCETTKTFDISGSDGQIVCLLPSEGSLGKVSLGKEKLGGAGMSSLTGLPPKFRVIETFDNTDFFENSIQFSVLGVDNRMELLAFGLDASVSTQLPAFIKK